jgi:hypothetical protein
MPIEIGHAETIFQYPVKSMSGERFEAAEPGWHGFDGDRRLAFRRIDDRGEFPWLTASKVPGPLPFRRTAAKTVFKETFVCMFARRMAKKCQCSERTRPRRSDVGTGLSCS